MSPDDIGTINGNKVFSCITRPRKRIAAAADSGFILLAWYESQLPPSLSNPLISRFAVSSHEGIRPSTLTMIRFNKGSTRIAGRDPSIVVSAHSLVKLPLRAEVDVG